ncbi:MAG: TonB-dependent receptor [Bacteroidia bacterium]|nr:TonB-dependent receptor [Bacteroidia bacterium]
MEIKSFAKLAFAIACVCIIDAKAQFSLSGKIINNLGEPVPFAAIGIKNTQLTTISDLSGEYSFKGLKPSTYVISVHSVGFLNKTDTIVLNGDLNHNPVMIASSKQLDEVVVDATRVDKTNGMAYSNVDAETINKQNLGQDAPYMLNQLSNVVVSTDAGNGVGYTGIRIRGSDPSRINVTINGVPVNDAESQGVFYVNMPDLASNTDNIQVQRGVGTSGNGAGAFGATINFQTNQLKEKPYAKAVSTAGSFNTFRNTLMAGTGLLNDRFTLDARVSKITSDGYIDRASSDLNSYYLSAGYYGKKSVLKLINFYGSEKTYQAWYYVPEDSIKNGNRTFNPAGLYFDGKGKARYYDNETDNYKQNNFQLHFIHQFNSRLSLNVTAHYTKGAGYYEQYKDPSQDSAFYSSGSYFSRYNLPDLVIGGDTIMQTSLVRRLWLDNDFGGGIINLNYRINARLNMVLGGGYNQYSGRHFGRLMWMQYAGNTNIDFQYSRYTTEKTDGNIYLKTNYRPISKLNIFLDLQLRKLNYHYFGLLDSTNQDYQNQPYTFFNPKLGLSYDLNRHLNGYASIAIANKEPSGDDLIKNFPSSRPVSENMVDLEIGVKYSARKIYMAVNFYNMHYKDQLVLNGQVDNVGNPRHVNVANSFRRGIELELSYELNKYLVFGGNLSLSSNKIENFKEYIDDQHVNQYSNTDISFSPNQVSSAIFTVKPLSGLEISFINKNIGKQYLDNTSNSSRSIAAYNVLDARINYNIKTKIIPEIGLMLSVYNLLNEKYSTNGYTYSYYVGSDLQTFNYFAPAAGTYVMGGISLKF